MFVFQKLNSFLGIFFWGYGRRKGRPQKKVKKAKKKQNQFAHILPMHSMKSVYYLNLFDFTI